MKYKVKLCMYTELFILNIYIIEDYLKELSSQHSVFKEV